MAILTTRISCSHVLFDLDGTLVDSTWMISECWRGWAIENHLDPETIEVLSRGRTAKETISLALPTATNIDELAYDFIQKEIKSSTSLNCIVQAREFLQTLPADRWGVVTSSTSTLAKARLHAARLPNPRVLVTSELVVKGKPSPDCYIVATELLGVQPKDCLVFEDSKNGIEAAINAGMRVIQVNGQDEVEGIACFINNYAGISIQQDADSLVIVIDH